MKLLKKETEQKTQNKPERSKGAKIALKIANIVINVLIVVVLLTSILIATLALTSKANGGIPTIFGYTVQTIQSNSMKGGSPDGYEGGDFEAGDIVIGKKVEFDPSVKYQVGDIITFNSYLEGDKEAGKQLLCHRIINVVDRTAEGGFVYYQTQGDNRMVAQVPDQKEEADYIIGADIVSVVYTSDYDGKIIRGMGGFLDYIRSSQGFFLVVLLPMIIFFLYEIIRVVMNAINYRNAKAKEEIQQTKEEQQAAIDAAVKAALAAAGKTDAPAAPAEDSAPEAPADAAPAADAAADLPADAAKAPEMSAEEYEEFKRFMAFKKAQEKEE